MKRPVRLKLLLSSVTMQFHHRPSVYFTVEDIGWWRWEAKKLRSALNRIACPLCVCFATDTCVLQIGGTGYSSKCYRGEEICCPGSFAFFKNFASSAALWNASDSFRDKHNFWQKLIAMLKSKRLRHKRYKSDTSLAEVHWKYKADMRISDEE